MKRFVFALSSVLLLAAAGAQSAAEVSVGDGTVTDGAVTVAAVEAAEAGFIVVHRTSASGEGPLVPTSIGHAPVAAGGNRDVVVPLTESVAPGERLFAMLHVDSDGDGVYGFGPGSTDVDPPAMRDGTPVMSAFTSEGGSAGAVDGLIVRASALTVDETQLQLEKALQANDFNVVAVIDHADGAENAGLELRPTRLVIFGKPSVGTGLMQGAATAAIDLPQKMLIWQDAAGGVWLAYNDPRYLARRHGLEGQGETLDKIANALNSLAKAAGGG